MLGVLHKGQQVQGTNLDDLDEGTYYCTVGNTNSPADFCWVLTVFDRPSGTGDKSQLAWALNNIWVRRKSGTWGDWLKYNAVADFYKDYNSLASLANALGVIENKDRPSTLDLNEIRGTGFYLIQSIHGTYINKPSGAAGYGALIVFFAGNYLIQIWINDTIGDKMYIRGNWSNGQTWYGWREIALTPQT